MTQPPDSNKEKEVLCSCGKPLDTLVKDPADNRIHLCKACIALALALTKKRH